MGDEKARQPWALGRYGIPKAIFGEIWLAMQFDDVKDFVVTCDA